MSGGVKGATAGTLAFMVGGSDDAVDAARPVLDPMAGKIIHCGSAGAGQAAKLCNNMVLAVQQIAVGEAFVLAEKLGLSAQSLFDVITGATGNCWAVHTNCPVPGPVPTSPANNDFKPGFATALMNKDLGLAMAAVSSTGSAAPLGTHAAEIYAVHRVRRRPTPPRISAPSSPCCVRVERVGVRVCRNLSAAAGPVRDDVGRQVGAQRERGTQAGHPGGQPPAVHDPLGAFTGVVGHDELRTHQLMLLMVQGVLVTSRLTVGMQTRPARDRDTRPVDDVQRHRHRQRHQGTKDCGQPSQGHKPPQQRRSGPQLRHPPHPFSKHL